MTAAEGTFLGLAKQTAFGTPNVTDADFKYLLFSEGSVSPNNITLPLDPEVGGGALLRNVVKVGVNSSGALRFIPRPETMGHFLYGVTGSVQSTQNANLNGITGPVPLTGSAQPGYYLGIHQPDAATVIFIQGSAALMAGDVVIHGNVAGVADSETLTLSGTAKVTGVKLFETVTSIDFPAETNAGDEVSVGYDGGYYTHVFKLPTDQFAAPFWTVRYAPGNMWGEQFQDVRLNMLALEFAGANFVRSTGSMMGGLPKRITDMSAWGALAKVDGGPQFLAPYGRIEVPDGTLVNVLSGSFAAVSQIPLDEQYIVGQFTPQGLDIVSRAFMLTLNVKISDETLYRRAMYDPADGANWAAAIFREANIDLGFRSDVGQYEFKVQANGNSGADANVVWSAAPLGVRAQRQVVMQLTGTFIASPDASDPIVLTLINKRASY